MPDRILSTVVYDSITKGYTNLSPGVSPLILNDTGDLIFNTNNLALYNKNSNNKIIRPTGYQYYLFPTVLDNVLIGSNSSTIYGQNQTIINSESSIISGEFLQDDLNTYTCFNSIVGSVNSSIRKSYGGMILNSYSSQISGGIWQSIINSYGGSIINTTCTSLLSAWYSSSLGTIRFLDGTGGLYATEKGGFGNAIIGGSQNSFSEKNADRSAFTGILAFNGTFGTGYLSGVTNFYSAYSSSSMNMILGGGSNSIIKGSSSAILGSSNSRICGTTNIAYLGGPIWGGDIACWRDTSVNAVLGGAGSLIADQVEHSIILGGCSNTIRASCYPYYYRHDGSGFQTSRLVTASAILGGRANQILTGSSCSVILGGCANIINNESLGGIIIGGKSNILRQKSCYSLVGGDSNTVNGCQSFIGGGFFSTISGNFNFIGGGQANRNCTQQHSTIVGGCANWICTGSNYSFIGGGGNHCIINSPYSYVIGGRCAIIQSGHDGSAVLSDGQNRIHNSYGPNTLTLDFASGIYAPSGGVIASNLVYNTGNQTINGTKTFTSIKFQLANEVYPITSNSVGQSGQFIVDSNYIYYHNGIKWRRSALSEW